MLYLFKITLLSTYNLNLQRVASSVSWRVLYGLEEISISDLTIYDSIMHDEIPHYM